MSAVRVLVIVAPLRLTFWVLAIGSAVIVVLMAIGVARHLARARDDRARTRVRGQLEPVFSRFLETTDWERLARGLRPAFMPMDRGERPVAAVLVTDIMQEASWSQKEQLRSALERAGIVELGHRGTRRLSPWRPYLVLFEALEPLVEVLGAAPGFSSSRGTPWLLTPDSLARASADPALLGILGVTSTPACG